MTASDTAEDARPTRLGEDGVGWEWAVLGLIAAALIARLGALALEVAPLHFDEAQYWTYGEALDWGYYSKPPMVAWVIRLGVELFGDTAFGVRALSPVIHAWIAWLVFAVARRVFDARTGFWSALAYLTMPGVTVGAALMTTDTPMMLGWAIGLYGLVRAMAPDAAGHRGALIWWFVFGLGIGVGLLSKYTVVALPLGALGYALFARERAGGPREWPLAGPVLATLTALAVFAPNLWWNAQNNFASILHVVDNTKLGGGPAFDLSNLAEFFGAQFGVFGPILFGALLLMATRREWRLDWPYRLLLWLAVPLIAVMTVQSFLSRAHPNWAAPAYIAASIAVTAWMLDRGRQTWLAASAALGVAIFVGFFGAGAHLKEAHRELPRVVDIFKKIRPEPAVCARALAVREGRPLVSPDRRTLAVCMFIDDVAMDDIRVFSPGAPGNHYQLAAPLRPDETREMLFILQRTEAQAAGYLNRFSEVRVLETGRIDTHADRSVDYVVAAVRGYTRPD